MFTYCTHVLKAYQTVWSCYLAVVVQKGAYLFGTVDITGTLLYDHGWRVNREGQELAGLPEVFLHLSVRASKSSGSNVWARRGVGAEENESEVISGVVAVVKCPCLHPGDIQLCYAVSFSNPKQFHPSCLYQGSAW